MDVGVRELKQHLSEYLDRAERGEVITVTERGRPKVRLVALGDHGALERGIQEGWLRPAGAAELGPVRRVAGARRTTDVLAEDRGE
jgi:prevent-host-death family protein